ncbi:hypothetical protein AAFF_G00141640 [Aldrovandia affinis]|uniref:Uncharacterized protein n=1 Tax=Aldrovandia affinis TaxID=143900 RepID=A0AAD7X310_9TELE|nr:hypothetical protein AAFF_G00141640 [Aldrovandia affinis]
MLHYSALRGHTAPSRSGGPVALAGIGRRAGSWHLSVRVVRFPGERGGRLPSHGRRCIPPRYRTRASRVDALTEGSESGGQPGSAEGPGCDRRQLSVCPPCGVPLSNSVSFCFPAPECICLSIRPSLCPSAPWPAHPD